MDVVMSDQAPPRAERARSKPTPAVLACSNPPNYARNHLLPERDADALVHACGAGGSARGGLRGGFSVLRSRVTNGERVSRLSSCSRLRLRPAETCCSSAWFAHGPVQSEPLYTANRRSYLLCHNHHRRQAPPVVPPTARPRLLTERRCWSIVLE